MHHFGQTVSKRNLFIKLETQLTQLLHPTRQFKVSEPSISYAMSILPKLPLYPPPLCPPTLAPSLSLSTRFLPWPLCSPFVVLSTTRSQVSVSSIFLIPTTYSLSSTAWRHVLWARHGASSASWPWDALLKTCRRHGGEVPEGEGRKATTRDANKAHEASTRSWIRQPDHGQWHETLYRGIIENKKLFSIKK